MNTLEQIMQSIVETESKKKADRIGIICANLDEAYAKIKGIAEQLEFLKNYGFEVVVHDAYGVDLWKVVNCIRLSLPKERKLVVDDYADLFCTDVNHVLVNWDYNHHPSSVGEALSLEEFVEKLAMKVAHQ